MRFVVVHWRLNFSSGNFPFEQRQKINGDLKGQALLTIKNGIIRTWKLLSRLLTPGRLFQPMQFCRQRASRRHFQAFSDRVLRIPVGPRVTWVGEEIMANSNLRQGYANLEPEWRKFVPLKYMSFAQVVKGSLDSSHGYWSLHHFVVMLPKVWKPISNLLVMPADNLGSCESHGIYISFCHCIFSGTY